MWALGVVAWEILTFAALPYAKFTNQEVILEVCIFVLRKYRGVIMMCIYCCRFPSVEHVYHARHTHQ